MEFDDSYKEEAEIQKERPTDNKISPFEKPKSRIQLDSEAASEYYDNFHKTYLAEEIGPLREALCNLESLCKNYTWDYTPDFTSYCVASELLEVAFTFGAAFSIEDNERALYIINGLLDNKKESFTEYFLEAGILDKINECFFIEEFPKREFLNMFKKIIAYSREAANSLFEVVSINEMIDAFMALKEEANVSEKLVIHRMLLSIFKPLPFDEQPDEDVELIHNLCIDYIYEKFPRTDVPLLAKYDDIGIGFKTIFTLYAHMGTTQERCTIIRRSYAFYELIHLGLKSGDVNTLKALFLMLSTFVVNCPDHWRAIDTTSIMNICESDNETNRNIALEFLVTSLRASRCFYELYKANLTCILLSKIMNNTTFKSKKIIHEFICVYVTNTDVEDKKIVLARGMIKHIVDGLTYEDSNSIIHAVDAIISIPDYFTTESGNSFKALNLQAAHAPEYYQDLIECDEEYITEDVKEKLEELGEDEAMKYLIEEDCPTDPEDF